MAGSALRPIRETWRSYDKSWRCGIIVSLTIGVGCFVAGIAGDLFCWWNGWTFAPNALNWLMGGFTGAPFALVLVTTIERERDVTARRKAVESLSDRAWDEFKTAIKQYCSHEWLTSGMPKAAAGLSWDQLRTELIDEFADATFDEAQFDAKCLDDIRGKLISSADSLDWMIAEIKKGWPDGRTLTIEWAAIVQAWALLSTYVRVQRLENGLAWMPGDAAAEIHIALSKDPKPVEVVSTMFDEMMRTAVRLHGIPLSSEVQYGIQDIPSHLRYLATESPNTIRDAVRDDNGIFKTLIGDHYFHASARASMFFTELGGLVLRAEAVNGWPNFRHSDTE